MNLDLGATAVAIVLLIVISAFFSASETALTAVSRARLNEIERRGSRRAAMALDKMSSTFSESSQPMQASVIDWP